MDAELRHRSVYRVVRRLHPCTMMDYAAWIQRGQRFVRRLESLPGEVQLRTEVAPPLGRHDADMLAKRLPQGLPSPLYEFVTQGSARCDCHYWWEPPTRPWPRLREIFPDNNFIYGGPVLCHANQFLELQESRLGWAEIFDGDDAQAVIDRELWRRCTPFAHIGNGDMLALDATVESDGPAPVVYLSHDGGSAVISPSFDDFLHHWQVMSYIGPEIWLLQYWIDEQTKRIESRNSKSALLRELLLANG